MDKNAIKKYAVWARNELIARVTQKAEQYEITEKKTTPADADCIGGRLLTDAEKKQRAALIEKIKADDFEQVMEEVAYIWFNRFTALRFMEVNNYLPSHTRVFTNEAGEFKPQILADAIQLDLEGLDMDKVFELKDSNKTEELYKYLLITQCNALSGILPGMFQKIEDYTELLLPDYLLREGSVVERLVKEISEDNWTDEVEIIGWLYQYYISEKHEEVVNPLYGKGIKKEDIPAATQLFTTDWIVRYMVDNSLGRFWIEHAPNSQLAQKLEFYIPPKEMQYGKIILDPTSIGFFDPCLGSGHILAYAFDVFMEIYRETGYTDREATEKIIENNLFGLDIDDRAYQLATFSIMMKARRYNRRIFTKPHKLNIAAIQESNDLPIMPMFKGAPKNICSAGEELVTAFKDAKEIGSLLVAPKINYEEISNYLDLFEQEAISDLEKYDWNNRVYGRVRQLVKQSEIMSQRYTIVCTNPPYMNNLKGELKKYIFKKYKDYSGDIFSAFMVRNLMYTSQAGYAAFMTPNVWMYIKSFEKLRSMLISQKSITSFLLLAKGAFFKEATVDICSFVVANEKGKEGSFVRLEQYKGDMEKQKKAFLDKEQVNKDNNIFYRRMDQFCSIPGSPIAFWISDNLLKTFDEKSIDSITTSKAGIVSGNDAYFMRLWHEISFKNITLDANNFEDQTAYKWVPINKGGAYRRYYGNHEYVINIYDLWNSPDKVNESVRRSEPGYYFKEAMTWSYVTTGKSSFRYTNNKTSATAAPNLFFNSQEELYYTLAFANCCITQNYLDLLNPTINLNVTNVSTLPLIVDKTVSSEVIDLCKANIALCKTDWDLFETSWDFQSHPLVPMSYERKEQLSAGMHSDERRKDVTLLSERYNRWKQECDRRFYELKENEEELNSIFISIYDLQNEISPDVDEKDITVRKSDLQRDICSLISYAVGCMFGRYSIDMPGLIYAGGEWDSAKYSSFRPDKDAIIPICDDEYFDDDIVSRFVEFLEVVYGKETVEDNLRFIADALGGKGTSRDIIRNYFMNDFYSDHVKIYQKRPIYWLFDSGKKNGFKCLVYMHRYQPDTIARIRTDYVHEQQSRYRIAIADLENRINGAGTSDRVKLNKQMTSLQAQAKEIREYEEKIHHLADQMISIDLDDGVKHNYEIFKDVLARIK